MQKSSKISFLLIIVFILVTSCVVKNINKYKDGDFAGISKSIYDREYLYGVTKITISQGKITKVDFNIIDLHNKVFFDEKYEAIFKDYPEYIEKCRKELKAINIYQDILLKNQKIDSLDAISGATWSYNMFESSLAEALKKALK